MAIRDRITTWAQAIVSFEGRDANEIRTASTLSLYDRLAQQSREIIVTDDVFSVSAIPEPE